MAPRINPVKDAIKHVILKTDKISLLEVKYIDAVKGRGVFAKGPVCKGSFVVEYRGERITEAEYEKRKLNNPLCAVYIFAFRWQGKTWCIDASEEDGSFGRLVNDDHKHPNCRMKKIDVNENPHLCLFALDDIKQGEEITYDYGFDCPWRTQPTSVCTCVDDSQPPHPSNTECSTVEQDRTNEEPTNVYTCVDDSQPPHPSNTECNTVEQDRTNEEPTSVYTCVDDSQPPYPSNTECSTVEQDRTNEEPTSVYTCVDDSQPPHPSNTECSTVEQDRTNEEPTIVCTSVDHFQPPHPSNNEINTIDQDRTNEEPTSVCTCVDDSQPPHPSNTEFSTVEQDRTNEENITEVCLEKDVFVPKLRRTRSVIMKNIDLGNPDDLFDSASGSGEEYIPNSRDQSDSDSDASLKTDVKVKLPFQNCMLDECSSGTPVCDSTSDKISLDRDRCILTKGGAVPDEPDDASSSQSIVVNSCAKKDGQRVYNKRHYCLYCSKPFAKLARHLEQAHEDKSDVARALSFPKGSKQRKQHLDYIRNRGNYAHNAAVMESGSGELVPFKRPITCNQ